MTPELASVKEFVQQVVEAIAVALSIDVMVFDPERTILAGSGVTKAEIGTSYNENSLTGSILVSGHPIITRDSGRSEECRHCYRYGTCLHLAVVAYPIKIESDVLGSFCLVATDEKQKKRLLTDEEGMMKFLDKACQMIGSVINERRVQDQLNTILKRYDNVVNTVHEGIIVTDEMSRIIHLNRSALELLGVTPEEILNRHITKVFHDFSLTLDELAKRNKIEIEITYQKDTKHKKKSFLATVMPILAEEGLEIKGATISMRSLKEVHSYAAKLVGTYSKYEFKDIVGQSEEIVRVKNKLQKAALTDSTILIRGESGTGKELFAHAVHGASYRRKEPFIAINCSAIPETLIESELFGYEEGAFTGAKRGGKPGKFELADGGTLFLDELGDMPLHVQSKLLRVLENHSIERVGGIESITTNVRIIAATNRNLEEMVERSEFRGDLYYRLSVIPIFIPSLKERKQDIPLFISYFLEKYGSIMDRPIQQLDTATMATLLNYSWPGNVRELQNTIEYAINMSEIGQEIMLEHLPQKILAMANVKNEVEDVMTKQIITKESDKQTKIKLKNLEKEIIKEALERFDNTTIGKEMAAKYLGISISTLYRKLKEISY